MAALPNIDADDTEITDAFLPKYSHLPSHCVVVFLFLSFSLQKQIARWVLMHSDKCVKRSDNMILVTCDTPTRVHHVTQVW